MRENNNSKVQLHFYTYQGNLTQNKIINQPSLIIMGCDLNAQYFGKNVKYFE
jgi:hypothetical protein